MLKARPLATLGYAALLAKNSRSVSRSKLLLLKIPIKRVQNHACMSMSFAERERFIQSLFHSNSSIQGITLA